MERRGIRRLARIPCAGGTEGCNPAPQFTRSATPASSPALVHLSSQQLTAQAGKNLDLAQTMMRRNMACRERSSAQLRDEIALEPQDGLGVVQRGAGYKKCILGTRAEGIDARSVQIHIIGGQHTRDA